MGSVVAAEARLAAEAPRVHPLVADGLLALLITGLTYASFVGVGTPEEGDRLHPADSFGAMLLLAQTVPLVWRRRAPLLVFTVVCLAFLAFEAVGYHAPPLPFAPLIALFTVAARSAPPVAAMTAAAMATCTVVAALIHNDPLTDDAPLDYLVSIAAASLLGYGVQLSRVRTTLLERQARQLADTQAAKTALAVEQERSRIARELHDIVAHHVSVIVAQAGGAQKVFGSNPNQAREALGSIEVTGREALTEMRRLLGVLHTQHGATELAPLPGLDQLPALVAQARRAGLSVDLSTVGTPRPLDAGVELSAYRIVQEALTNSLKHAGPAHADVVIGYRPDVLEVEVHDDGHGCLRDPIPGQGLVGMRQRAALLGGRLDAGPVGSHGFRVTAQLPVNGGAA
jgi:signal transduction histidine kinase